MNPMFPKMRNIPPPPRQLGQRLDPCPRRLNKLPVIRPSSVPRGGVINDGRPSWNTNDETEEPMSDVRKYSSIGMVICFFWIAFEIYKSWF